MKRYKICIGLSVLCLFLCMTVLPAVAQDADTSKSDYEMMFWESVKDSNNVDMYRAYIEQYPHGHFAPIAKIKIDALSKNGPKEVRPVNKTPLKNVQMNRTPMPDKRYQLRSRPKKLLERDIQNAIKKHNFSIPKRNPDGHFKNAFVDNHDGTITDEATGLIWQKSSSGHKISKVRAKRYIENLNWEKFAGHSTWRLPTLDELLSLMESRPQAPSSFYIDAIFQDPSTYTPDRVWSADEKEPAMGNLHGAWALNFWRGTILRADWEWDSGANVTTETNVDNFVKAVCTK